MSVRKTLLLVAACGALLTGTAGASEVTVSLVGEAGPAGDPAYVVLIDDTVVGAGMLSPPEGVQVRQVPDVGALAAKLTFPIPDGVLKADSVVNVRMMNDSYDAASGKDATIYVAGVAVDGASADVAKGKIVTADGEVMPNYFAAGGSLMLTWNASARFTSPEGGWPQASGSAPAPATSASEPAAAQTQPQTEPIATNEPVAEPVACSVDESLAILDFENGMFGLTPAAAQQIDAFLADKSVAGCKLAVVGYASLGGAPDVNVAMSTARAKTIFDYVESKQLGFAEATTSGFGATDQFGAPKENRRVVLTISP
ncbi:MAG: hypothetical protein J0I99_05040 [Devosia sp.]|uniref:OmpA family protein n=1 Tax=Devosia sp. TaxID=1871048 RepID=UPI001AC8C9C0|nr:hypothetical protein [Devosia sp.]MBN9315082.1 hypothetical protein [Devosia sp.]